MLLLFLHAKETMENKTVEWRSLGRYWRGDLIKQKFLGMVNGPLCELLK